MITFSKELIIERLWADNSWWQTQRIEKYYQAMKPRSYFDLFYPLASNIDLRYAVVLMGPRQIGKTVMLNQTVQALINDGISARKICFISVDTPIFNKIDLNQLFDLAREASGENDPANWFVIFDEIQYFENWEVHLKVLVDRYKETKFIVSGSAAAALKRASMESGAGRFTDFILPPLPRAQPRRPIAERRAGISCDVGRAARLALAGTGRPPARCGLGDGARLQAVPALAAGAAALGGAPGAARSGPADLARQHTPLISSRSPSEHIP